MSGALSQQQRQIVAATFNVVRDRERIAALYSSNTLYYHGSMSWIIHPLA